MGELYFLKFSSQFRQLFLVRSQLLARPRFAIFLSLIKIKSPYISIFLIFNSNTTSKSECKLHTSMLLLHPNCNLTKIEYYFLLGEIIIASALLPHTFTTPLKYIVHQSNFPSSTENTSSSGGTA